MNEGTGAEQTAEKTEEKDEAADSGFSDDEFGELLDLLNKNKR